MKVSLVYDVTPLTTEESDKLETGPRTPFNPDYKYKSVEWTLKQISSKPWKGG